MTLSALRTLVVGEKASYSAIFPSGLPYDYPGVKEPDSFLDFSWDATPFLVPVNDSLASVTVRISPWGPNELVASSLAVTGNIITFWLAEGIPRRRYHIRIDATAVSNRTFGWPIGILVDPSVAPYPLPGPPANTGFGTALTWTANGTLTVYGTTLALATPGQWPTSSAGLLPGALYAASTPGAAYIYAVPGFGPVVLPPIFYGDITGADLLAHGAVGLPQADPHVINQIWINGELLCVSLG